MVNRSNQLPLQRFSIRKYHQKPQLTGESPTQQLKKPEHFTRARRFSSLFEHIRPRTRRNQATLSTVRPYPYPSHPTRTSPHLLPPGDHLVGPLGLEALVVVPGHQLPFAVTAAAPVVARIAVAVVVVVVVLVVHHLLVAGGVHLDVGVHRAGRSGDPAEGRGGGGRGLGFRRGGAG